MFNTSVYLTKRFTLYKSLLSIAAGAIVVVLCLCISYNTSTAPRKYGYAPYDRWTDYPPDTLLAKGRAFGHDPQKADSALVCFSIVANRYYEGNQTEKDAQLCVKGLNGVGSMYSLVYGDHQRGLDYFTEALNLSDKWGYDSLRTFLYHNIGNAYTNSGNTSNFSFYTKLAQKNYSNAFHESTNGNDTVLINVEYANYLTSILAEGNYADAKADMLFYKKLNIPSTVPGSDYINAISMGIADMNSNKPASAIEEFKKLAQLSNDIPHGDFFRQCSLIGLSRIAYQTKQPQLLKECTDEIGNDIDSNDGDMELYVTKYQYAMSKEMGDKALADKYYSRYLQASDSLNNATANITNKHKPFFTKLTEISNRAKDSSNYLHYILAIVLGLIAFAIVFIVTDRLFKDKQSAHSTETKKYAGSKLSEEEKDKIEKEITKVMNDSETISDMSFSLQRLAELTGFRLQDVSQVVNERFGKNFKTLLSEFRIKEACRRIDNAPPDSYIKIEALAMEVGFKSRSSFTTTFKRVVGVSPSEYHKKRDGADVTE